MDSLTGLLYIDYGERYCFLRLHTMLTTYECNPQCNTRWCMDKNAVVFQVQCTFIELPDATI